MQFIQKIKQTIYAEIQHLQLLHYAQLFANPSPSIGSGVSPHPGTRSPAIQSRTGARTPITRPVRGRAPAWAEPAQTFLGLRRASHQRRLEGFTVDI